MGVIKIQQLEKSVVIDWARWYSFIGSKAAPMRWME